MVLRLWKGRARPEMADAYARHLTTEVFRRLERLDGYVRGRLTRRITEGEVEFLVITEWTSLETIRAFAGDELDRAVVEPDAQAVLSAFDPHVEHFEVVHESTAAR